MEIELTVAVGTGLAISANTFPVCSDGARQATVDGTATAAATATGSRLSEDVAPARAGAPGGVRPGAGDDAAPPFPPTTGRAYPRTGPAGAAGPAVADMPANGRTSVIASGSTLLPAIEGRAGHPTPTSGQLPLQFPPLARSGGGQPRPRPVVVIRHVTSSARSCPEPARHSPSPRHTRSSATRPSAASKGSPVSATQSARPSQPRLVSPDSSAQISLRRPVSPAQSEDPISRPDHRQPKPFSLDPEASRASQPRSALSTSIGGSASPTSIARGPDRRAPALVSYPASPEPNHRRRPPNQPCQSAPAGHEAHFVAAH